MSSFENWQIKRQERTTAEIQKEYTHYDKTTRTDEPLHTHEIKPRAPRDPKYRTEPFYKDKEAHRTSFDESELHWRQYK